MFFSLLLDEHFKWFKKKYPLLSRLFFQKKRASNKKSGFLKPLF